MTDAIYLHIPFCKQKCHYCDFFILTNMEKEYNNYVEHLIKEINLYPKLYFDTIYFGGGTPSVLKSSDITKILSNLNYSNDSEITLELNPNDIQYNHLKELRDAGINRLSIGIQSFNDKLLKEMNRSHDKSEALKTFDDARKAGFDNISIDLIFALPNQTIEDLKVDLEYIEKLRPEHISIYSLIWEDKTMFSKQRRLGLIKPVSEDLEADMFELIINTLTKLGYEHYEISSFALNKKGRHNKKYWQNKEYIGVGISASGFYNNIRYSNKRSLVKYYSDIDKGIKPIDERTIELMDDKLTKTNKIILGLRMIDEGIDSQLLDEQEKKELQKLEYIYEKNNKIFLTKKGIFLSNNVLERFV